MISNPTVLSLPELIERAGAMETNEEKIDYLKKHCNRHMRWFIYMLYDQELITNKQIPVPHYEPSHYPSGMNPMTLHHAIPRFEKACSLYERNPKRTEDMLVTVLESVNPKEAELFVMILKGQRKFDGVSKAVWKGVFPSLFPLGSSGDT